MRARTFLSIRSVHATLLAALGAPLFACGGQADSFASNPDAGASPDSGPTPDGGGSLPDTGPTAPDASHPDAQPPPPPGDACSGPARCENPTPILVGGKDTGYDTCDGGTRRRRANVACPVLLPRPANPACAVDSGIPFSSNCTSDSECTDKPNGVCGISSGGGLPAPGCFCSYGCVNDSDCGSGAICVCGDPVGHCESSSCSTGADCAAGAECADYTQDPGCYNKAFACQTACDQCFSDSDCAGVDGGYEPELCTIQNGARVCGEQRCAIGRPFLVGGEARVAPPIERADWRDAASPRVDGIADETRARLADEWTRTGQMEHASVAAFARFALQLLAVGAPSHLLEATHRAMADETRHAKLAFGLASAYAGEAIGPGKLAIDACLDGCDLESLLRTVILEGCIGETVAAVEAREALEEASDPAVRAVLEVIARDETRHAELAWRTVAWALESGGADVRRIAEETFASVAAEGIANDTGEADEDLLPHGVVGPVLRTELRAAAIRDAVLPCARALLAASNPSASAALAAAPRLAPHFA